MKSPLLWVLVVSAVIGCKSSKTEPVAATAPAMPAASPLAIAGATVATLPNMSIAERFAAERKGRPEGLTPTAEDVYASLESAGLTIVDRKQHLASPFGARYCLGARAVAAGDATTLQLSVCEFVSAEAARIGRDYSAEGLKAIPLRTVYANKQTTLTVREEKQDPATDAQLRAAAAAYARL